MAQCLITQLKGAVTDKNLPKMGIAKIVCPAVSNPVEGKTFIQIKAGSGAIKIKTTDGYFTKAYNTGEHLTEAIIEANKTLGIHRTPDACTFEVEKYTLKSISGGDTVSYISPTELQYAVEMTGCYMMKGNVKDVRNVPSVASLTLAGLLSGNSSDFHIFAENNKENLESLSVAVGNTVSMRLMDVAILDSLTSLRINGNISYSIDNVTGDISEIGSLSLETLELSRVTNITGDLVDYVLTARSSGRTTGSIDLPLIGTCGGASGINFNGVKIGTQQNNSLSWTATTITFNGNTISK